MKTKHNYVTSSFILLWTINLLLPGCAPENRKSNEVIKSEREIVGLWESTPTHIGQQNVAYTFARYDFRSDGTCDFTVLGMSTKLDPNPFRIINEQRRYKLEGNQLQFGNEQWNVRIDGDRIYITRIDDGFKDVLTRKPNR